VLEAAGVNLHLTVEQVSDSVEQLGIGFLFAPHHHPAMQHIAPVRKELAIRTLFNLLGPLVNPASAPNQLLGVFSSQWLLPLAQVLQNLGSEHVMVVHAQDGLDEISLACETDIAELKQGNIEQYRVCPEQFGFQRQSLSGLAIQNVSESLAIMQSVLANQPSAALDIVLLNAGAAIYTANLADSLVSGIEQARAAIATGAAMTKLQALIEWSQDQSLSV
jgi:anthranilate phosphoribosyltransferase